MKILRNILLGTGLFLIVMLISYFTNINDALLGFWIVTIITAINYKRMTPEERKDNPRAFLGLCLFVGFSIFWGIVMFIVN